MANLMFQEVKNKRGQILYQDTESSRIYEKTEGGFSWPEALPAFVCVLGQEDKTGVLRVFNEYHESNMDNLARRLGTLKELFFVESWVVDQEGPKKSFDDLLYEIAKSQDQSFWTTQPRISADLGLAVQIIKRCFNQNVLIVPKGGILQSKIEQLNHADLTEPGLADKFPEIQVLANTICEFPTPEAIAERNRPKDKWDVDDDNYSPGSFMGM